MDLALRYAARTDLGLGPKSRNEDSGYAGPHLLVLADGMGGHAAGDVASSMVVGHLAPLDEESLTADQALIILEQTLRDANESLRQAMSESPSLDGMGTTTIALLRAGNKLAMAHIGDSRAFLLRDGEFTQITKDHSFVQQLLDEGRINPDEAEHHPQRSLVTRVMTGHPQDEPDLSMRELQLGDRYLLCSDGLSDFVGTDTIEEILTEAASPDDAAERCVEVALRASARDNVTVVVAEVIDLDATGTPPPSAPQVVGAAAARRRTGRTRAIPVGPAEKAAALSREVSGAPHPADQADEDTPARGRRSGARRVVGTLASVLAVAVVLVGGGYAAYTWSQRQYYVGESSGQVAIFRGVPQDLGPVALSSVDETSDVALSDLPLVYRDAVSQKITVSTYVDAQARVETLRAAAQLCRDQTSQGLPCTTVADFGSATATPSPTLNPTMTTTGPTPGLGTPSGPVTSFPTLVTPTTLTSLTTAAVP